jgi:hypothetical protein
VRRIKSSFGFPVFPFLVAIKRVSFRYRAGSEKLETGNWKL